MVSQLFDNTAAHTASIGFWTRYFVFAMFIALLLLSVSIFNIEGLNSVIVVVCF